MATSKIAAILLAAGEASRFRKAAGAQGPQTKLVAQHEGKALVRHVAEAAIEAGLAPLIVVTGHAQEAVQAALQGIAITPVHNADYASGMASSLKAGIAAVPPEAPAALVLLGDMPLVSAALIARLTEAFVRHPGAPAILPVCRGVRGNPALLSRALFPQLMQLSGDAGARQVLRGVEVIEIEVEDAGAHVDIDTPEALAGLPRSV